MGREKRSSSHLFNHWTEVRRRMRRAGRIALMLDFDGTLAPICSHPGEVRIPPATRQVLRRLAVHPGFRIFVISGRRLADVRRHVGVRRITYLGLHGWEHGRSRAGAVELHQFMQLLRHRVVSNVRGARGIWVEDKYVGFTVHCRLSPPRERARAQAALYRVIAEHLPRVRVLNGKNVWEVLPLEVRGKGRAVQSLLRDFPRCTLPIYAGDDLSDEAAFQALPRGITVRVGEPATTHARFVLHDPGDVREFLEKLEEEKR